MQTRQLQNTRTHYYVHMKVKLKLYIILHSDGVDRILEKLLNHKTEKYDF